ncbi:MAG: hypothetical protein GYB67_00220 [Chloroflexi bacterium]|nr:hypothetical protein [Chloroflexota bacterium]
MNHAKLYPWIDGLRARGWGAALSTALDVVEPLGPLSAQMLWIAAPALSLFAPRAALDDLAHTLETPGGIEALRAYLDAANDLDDLDGNDA